MERRVAPGGWSKMVGGLKRVMEVGEKQVPRLVASLLARDDKPITDGLEVAMQAATESAQE